MQKTWNVLARRENHPSPDFRHVERVLYGIGAQKAGTTWLYEQMKSHPQVFMGDLKEVHYWDTIHFPHLPYYKPKAENEVRRLQRMTFIPRALKYGVRGQHRRLLQAKRYRTALAGGSGSEQAYRAFLTDGRQNEPVVGDISPGYAMLEPKGFAAMDAAAPDARFIFIMRDPVSRLWSAMRHNRSRGFMNGNKDADLEDAFSKALAARDKGPMMMTDYATTIRNLEAAVPSERIGYFFYETLFSQETIDRIINLLGIDGMRADFQKVVNPGSDSDIRPPAELVELARQELSDTYAFIHAKFGDQVPASWLR